MSIDRSLKVGDALVRRRNVLTRSERIAQLEQTGAWTAEDDSPYGLQKVRVHKPKKKGKTKKKKDDDK